LTRWQPYPEYKESNLQWLGKIPEHWQTRRLKYATAVDSDTLVEDTDPNYVLQYVDIGNVDSQGNILNFQEMRFEKAPSRARRRVRDGDTIISTVRTYLKAIAYIENPPENLIVSTGFAVLRPRPEIEPKYLWRLVQSQGFVDAVVANSEGIGYPAIAPTKLAELLVWIPPLPEQRTIAAFLDRQTAKIDALIAEQRHLIELLQERRAALISHVVTKGLDPDVPMKDSGIPWLGEVPGHWEVMQVRYIAESLQTGPFGSQLHSSDYVANVIPVINPSHLRDGYIEPDFGVTVDRQTCERLERHKLRAGDIVFARRGELGRRALVTPTEDGWLCGTGSLRIRPRLRIVHPPFLNAVLSTRGVSDWLLLQAVGSTMDNLNTSILSRLPLPIPPVEEQRTVATYLDRGTAKIDTLVSEIETGIAHLEEYRTALISAAVTGKIDVRNALLSDVPAQLRSTDP